jgi:hypothetical protein
MKMIELRMPGRQVRTSFPELTRCVHCGELDAHTKPVVFVSQNKQDQPLLTVWLHERCANKWNPPSPLRGEHPGNYRVPYRPYVPVQERRKASFAFLRWPRTKRQCNVYCYCCEAYELPEHKLNRLGYEPLDGWSCRRFKQ